MNKLKTERVLVVEGRYDASKLHAIIETTIITLDGFSIYKDKEKQNLLKRLGRKNGIILLTDSDGAGFRLRTFITNIVGEKHVLQTYTPAIKGKEKRKTIASKEGLLGVEGVNSSILYDLLEKSLKNDINQPISNNTHITSESNQQTNMHNQDISNTYTPTPKKNAVTYLDLYKWGFSGTAGSAQRKAEFLKALNLPPRLSKKELVDILNRLYDYEFLEQKAKEFT